MQYPGIRDLAPTNEVLAMQVFAWNIVYNVTILKGNVYHHFLAFIAS